MIAMEWENMKILNVPCRRIRFVDDELRVMISKPPEMKVGM